MALSLQLYYNYIKNYNRINRIKTLINNSIRSKELFQIKFLNMIILIKSSVLHIKKRLSTKHLMTRCVLYVSRSFWNLWSPINHTERGPSGEIAYTSNSKTFNILSNSCKKLEIPKGEWCLHHWICRKQTVRLTGDRSIEVKTCFPKTAVTDLKRFFQRRINSVQALVLTVKRVQWIDRNIQQEILVRRLKISNC